MFDRWFNALEIRKDCSKSGGLDAESFFNQKSGSFFYIKLKISGFSNDFSIYMKFKEFSQETFKYV